MCSAGLRSGSFRYVSWSPAVHGLRRAQERLQQIQEGAFRCKVGEFQTWGLRWIKSPLHSSCSPSSPSFSYEQNALEYITMAALSKIFAVATTYPYQVVRARLQDQHNRYGGVVDVIGRTWRYGSARTGRLDPASFSRSLFPPQKRRRFGLLQRHRPKFDPRHPGLLHHLCGV